MGQKQLLQRFAALFPIAKDLKLNILTPFVPAISKAFTKVAKILSYQERQQGSS